MDAGVGAGRAEVVGDGGLAVDRERVALAGEALLDLRSLLALGLLRLGGGGLGRRGSGRGGDHDGVVERVGTLPISGNRLWIRTAAGDAFFYAHLSAFSPDAVSGRKVKAGTVLGFTLIQLLKNGLALMGVKGDATIVVIGTVLILSILITNALQHRSGRDG